VDHLLAHPYELGLAAYGIVGGALAFVSSFLARVSVSPSLDQLPSVLSATAGALLVIGGFAILLGLFDSSADLGVGFTRERIGLTLAGTGWAVYAACILALSVPSVLSWGLCFTLVVCKGLRLYATVRQERAIRSDVEKGQQ
jgi:hypothetical protein